MVFRYHGDTIWVEARFNGAGKLHVRRHRRDHLEHERRGAESLSLSRTRRLGVPVSQRHIGAARGAFDRGHVSEHDARDGVKERQYTREAGCEPTQPRGSFRRRPPETTTTYKISPALRITQHLDTLAYIRGCEEVHNDTTLFLLFGRDSVKRISRPERMFGQAMANGLYAKMRMSLMQEFTKSVQAPLPPDMPRVPSGCAQR